MSLDGGRKDKKESRKEGSGCKRRCGGRNKAVESSEVVPANPSISLLHISSRFPSSRLSCGLAVAVAYLQTPGPSTSFHYSEEDSATEIITYRPCAMPR
jgi:hypothetical protein